MRADRSAKAPSCRKRVMLRSSRANVLPRARLIWSAMLDPRIYRMGLVPVVLAVIVLAFSLGSQPGPLSTTLAPDAYSGSNAYATMTALAKQFPRRLPGSRADRQLAGFVARQLGPRGYQFAVSTHSFRGATVDGPRTLRNVIGTRAGQQNGSIVIVATRDALG